MKRPIVVRVGRFMTEDRSAVIIEAVFTSWSEAESARRALELLHPNQLSIESLNDSSSSVDLEAPESTDNSTMAVIGGFSGELNVLSLISDETEVLSGGQVYDDPDAGSEGRSKQEILLTVSVSSDSLPQAAEMITQNGGRFC
ncbi:hypothetical protein SAMN04487896_3697 [Paenibacillus sp. ov031]|nr:hypothetical protein SAMN05428961_105138 [Paenibacillus sp. OK060]SHN76597.1 hypothetical protein SAMN04487896_3697 [Paenibacillus sp. ov031]SLK11453.1 hypothetical protein SAMN06272722_107138 [Paenibacillus sp. RU5A]SOC72244.1 hypothetical protein SAMN05880581_107138 [Paenibacillus sp. RU26A]SOC74639.1 hypothetical protein SAMN05880586_107138 [Paenibacillus sp. RU5M]